MDICELIERGVRTAGGRTQLAQALDLRPNQITDAKRKGLPVSACFQLAELIGEDPAAVIAASELVTEKKPERRAVLLPFARHAAIVTLVAGVNLLLTPAPAQAAPMLNSGPDRVCIM